ncbi:hypothetical protein N7530_003889 [Penicillium desertorum]|jgi:hypothetical protein|uniref:Uncharacterized protein n=1 Tax=Penicillium desertorum TaxID=1303715 RepID=A0A9W9WXA3_9EURO|nr:hypothetical protein N7530_003889 [Penicillium desertorum]
MRASISAGERIHVRDTAQLVIEKGNDRKLLIVRVETRNPPKITSQRSEGSPGLGSYNRAFATTVGGESEAESRRVESRV